jgi:hypothetical protein
MGEDPFEIGWKENLDPDNDMWKDEEDESETLVDILE